MSQSKRIEMLTNMLEPAVTAAGCQLWGIEYIAQGKHSILRVYIDNEAGITVDDCAAVSHQVSAVLDVEDPINTEYNLEVSSPGLDRPLFTLEQFAQYQGEQLQVRLKMAVSGRRKFTAVLDQVSGTTLTFTERAAANDDVASWDVSFVQIEKANVVPVFE